MHKLFIFILFPLLFCNSCKEDETPEEEIPAERTVFAYLVGDNNLSSEIAEKIDALKLGMKQVDAKRNRLIIYADTKTEMPRLLLVQSDTVIKLRQYAEMNSASADNFATVFRYVTETYPADSYGLICFSHASGWLPKDAYKNPTGYKMQTRSLFEDSGNVMDVHDFAEAIPLTQTGKKLSFILFEACLMAGVEAVYPLRNKTDYILASAAEMLSNGFVEIYPEHLVDLFEKEPRLQDFAEAYFNYWNSRTGAARSATISILRTDALDALADAVSGILSQQQTPVNADDIQHFDWNAKPLFFDLSQYLHTVYQQNAGMETLYDEYQKVLADVVEYRASTPFFMYNYAYGFPISTHCGLTAYIPQDDLPDLNSDYRQTDWAKALNRTQP